MAELGPNLHADIYENVAQEFFHIFFHNLQAKGFWRHALRFQIRALPGPGKIGEVSVFWPGGGQGGQILASLVNLPRKVSFLGLVRPLTYPTPYPNLYNARKASLEGF